MTRLSGILSVREKCDGGDVADRVTEDPPGWMGGTSHLVLLIHGYNNNVDEARAAFSGLTSVLPDRFPKVGWFYWPGDADLGWFDFLDFISYPTEIEDAKTSAKRLEDTLVRVASENPGIEVTLVGHSLGCRLIAECIHGLAAKPDQAPRIKALILMAAALPVELVGAGSPLGQSMRRIVPEGYIFYSERDRVLQVAFPAGQTLAAGMGYETEVYLEAVGRHGNPQNLFPQPAEARHDNDILGVLDKVKERTR